MTEETEDVKKTQCITVMKENCFKEMKTVFKRIFVSQNISGMLKK
jgi:hypothetical protein